MINAILQFFTYAFMAIGAENVIFTRGLGLSNGLRAIRDPKKDTLYFAGSLTVFQLINSLLAYFIVPLVSRSGLHDYIRFLAPVIVVTCCAISYMAVVFALGMMASRRFFKRIVLSLTGASINAAIVGTILFSLTQNFGLLQTIGFAIGSGIGYFLAMIIIEEGIAKIRMDLVPGPFKGLPVTLIYVSIIALAIYGLTGHTYAL